VHQALQADPVDEEKRLSMINHDLTWLQKQIDKIFTPLKMIEVVKK